MSLTPEQLAMRRTGLTSTDLAAVSDLSPYRTPLQVYREKTEDNYRVEQTDAMLIGEEFEEPVARIYQRKTGATLEHSTTLRHPRLSLLMATPDRIATVNGEKRLLEVKTSSAYGARDEWGPEGSDAIPIHHFCQVQATMAVAGLKRADVAALFSGRDFAIFHVDFDPDFVEAMYEVGQAFWERHVVARQPPEPDGSAAWSRFIKDRLPVATEASTLLEATFQDVELVERFRQWQASETQAETEKLRVRQLLELRIGKYGGLQGPGWRIWWKNTKSSQATDWKTLALRLCPTKEQIEEHTKEEFGVRRFGFFTQGPRRLTSGT